MVIISRVVPVLVPFILSICFEHPFLLEIVLMTGEP